eukprot:4750978-Amphidinium_carterae.1
MPSLQRLFSVPTKIAGNVVGASDVAAPPALTRMSTCVRLRHLAHVVRAFGSGACFMQMPKSLRAWQGLKLKDLALMKLQRAQAVQLLAGASQPFKGFTTCDGTWGTVKGHSIQISSSNSSCSHRRATNATTMQPR